MTPKRRSFLRNVLLSVTAIVAAVCLAANGWCQGGISDADAIAALGPRPGCWQVRIQASSDPGSALAAKPYTLEECKRDILTRLTPEKRAKMNPEEIKFYENSYCANQVQSVAKAQEETAQTIKKGGESGLMLGCSMEGFVRMAQDVYGELDPRRHCVRKLEELAGQRHMQVHCSDLEADYVRVDAEHFTGTRREIVPGSSPNAQPVSSATGRFTSKWVAEAVAHMPYSPPNTNLDGVRALGPSAVLGLDPYRIVAIIDGKKMIAVWAQIFLQNAYAAATDEPKTLPNRLQDEFLRYMVASRAKRLQLDLLPPWRDQLAQYSMWYLKLDPDADPTVFMKPLPPVPRTSHIIPSPAQRAQLAIDPGFGVPEYALPEMVNEVERILWEAYFDRFHGAAEKQKELKSLQVKYKLAVVDPDFFVAVPSE